MKIFWDHMFHETLPNIKTICQWREFEYCGVMCSIYIQQYFYFKNMCYAVGVMSGQPQTPGFYMIYLANKPFRKSVMCVDQVTFVSHIQAITGFRNVFMNIPIMS